MSSRRYDRWTTSNPSNSLISQIRTYLSFVFFAQIELDYLKFSFAQPFVMSKYIFLSFLSVSFIFLVELLSHIFSLCLSLSLPFLLLFQVVVVPWRHIFFCFSDFYFIYFSIHSVEKKNTEKSKFSWINCFVLLLHFDQFF